MCTLYIWSIMRHSGILRYNALNVWIIKKCILIQFGFFLFHVYYKNVVNIIIVINTFLLLVIAFYISQLESIYNWFSFHLFCWYLMDDLFWYLEHNYEILWILRIIFVFIIIDVFNNIEKLIVIIGNQLL